MLTEGSKRRPFLQREDDVLLIAGASPKFQDFVLGGKGHSCSTPATGLAPGTSIGTTAPLTLYNPKGSGHALVLLTASISYLSGTLGAGTVHYAANTDPAADAVTGTDTAPVNLYIGKAGPLGKALHTSSLPIAPALMRPFCSLTALLASTAVGVYQVKDLLDGEFAIAEGCSLSLVATAAAGTSPLLVFGMSWVEVAL